MKLNMEIKENLEIELNVKFEENFNENKSTNVIKNLNTNIHFIRWRRKLCNRVNVEYVKCQISGILVDLI